MKKITLSVLAGFVTMFVLGYLWNLLMAGFYRANAPAIATRYDTPIMWALIASYLAISIIMAGIMRMVNQARPALSERLLFGAVFGITAVLPYGLVLYAIWDISLAYLLVDVVWNAVEKAIGAAVIGTVLFPAIRPAGAEAAERRSA